MKRIILCLLVLVSIVSFSCVEKTEQGEQVKPFTPPVDGKITNQQKDAYVKASIALKSAMEKYSLKIKEFSEKYEIRDDLSQLSDTVFLNEHSEIKRAWGELDEEWKKMQEEAYKSGGISEIEFNWIGGALTDTINTVIQKAVEKALTTVAESETEKEKVE